MTQPIQESNQTHQPQRTSLRETLRALGGLVAGLVGILGTEGIFRLARPLIVHSFGTDFAGIVHTMTLGFGTVALILFVLQYEIAHISEIGENFVASIRKVFSLARSPVDEVIRKEREKYQLEKALMELEYQRKLDQTRLSIGYEQEVERLVRRTSLTSETEDANDNLSAEQDEPRLPEKLKE